MEGVTLSEAEIRRLKAPVRSGYKGWIEVFLDGQWSRLQVTSPIKLSTVLVAYREKTDGQIWVRPREEIA